MSQQNYLKATIDRPTLTAALSIYFNEIRLADLVFKYLGNPFISTWRISADKMHVELPLDADGSYDFVVEWGDGSVDHIISPEQAAVKHTYTRVGDYTVALNGLIQGFGFGGNENNSNKHPSSRQIIDVSQWGSVLLSSKGFQFCYCKRLRISATDTPDLTQVADMKYMFYHAELLHDAAFSDWDTSRVTNMKSMFDGAVRFNGDISRSITQSFLYSLTLDT